MPSALTYLGLFPSECSAFPQKEQLNYRIVNIDSGQITEEGPAPATVYLPLTKYQAAFIHWRVKSWSLAFRIGPIAINKQAETEIGVYTWNFSIPATEFFLTKSLNYTNEKDLICRIWQGPANNLYVGVEGDADPWGAWNGNREIEIDSTAVIEFPEADPPEEPENYDNSRTVEITPEVSNFTASPNYFAINQLSRRVGQTDFLEFDSGRNNGLFYWPYLIQLNFELSNGDLLLFTEGFGGELPIRGYLTTNGSETRLGLGASLSPYKVRIELSDDENDFIELDLYDLTTEMTDEGPARKTFNVAGFDGIIIRPHEYWEHDPFDGGGPIYDGTTGEQIRPLP